MKHLFASVMLFVFCAGVFVFPARGADLPSEALEYSASDGEDAYPPGEGSGAEAQAEEPAEEIAFSSFPKELELAGEFSAYITLPKRAELDKESYSQKDFEVLSALPDESGLNIEIRALPFNLGVSTFTALSFTAEDGSRFISKAVNAEVKPVDTGVKEDKMLDIRSPYRPFNYWGLFWLAAIIALIAAGYIYYKRRAPRGRAALLKAFEEDKRPLDVVALDRLDYLLAGDLWDKGRYKAFYIAMIDILRDYLTLRFNIQAHNYTSKDLIRTLKRTSAFKGDLRHLEELQRSADYVKFAKVEPTLAQREADINNMRNIIIDTRPPRLENEEKDPADEKGEVKL